MRLPCLVRLRVQRVPSGDSVRAVRGHVMEAHDDLRYAERGTYQCAIATSYDAAVIEAVLLQQLSSGCPRHPDVGIAIRQMSDHV